MSDNNDHKEQRIGLWITGAAAVLAVLSVLFYAVWGWENGKIEGSPGYGGPVSETDMMAASAASAASAVQAASSEAGAAPQVDGASEVEVEEAAASGVSAADQILAASEPVSAASDDTRAVVENGVVKFYFATAKADLAANAQEALQDVLAGVKEGRKAVISGFHDATGNKAKNEALSKKRAFAVRDVLLGLGVPESQIELRKPENADAGSGAEARRVEVRLAE